MFPKILLKPTRSKQACCSNGQWWEYKSNEIFSSPPLIVLEFISFQAFLGFPRCRHPLRSALQILYTRRFKICRAFTVVCSFLTGQTHIAVLQTFQAIRDISWVSNKRPFFGHYAAFFTVQVVVYRKQTW